MMQLLEKIKKWFHNLRSAARSYQQLTTRVHNLEVQNDKLRRIIKQRTKVSAEVSCHGRTPHTVVVTGRYKHREYVEIFDLQTEDLHALIDQLRRMQEFAEISQIDTGPYDKSLKRVFEGELDL